MISEAYVFIEGLEAEPVICGAIRYDAKHELGRFSNFAVNPRPIGRGYKAIEARPQRP